MKISEMTKTSFKSNLRFYLTPDGKEIGTMSWPFREDIDWCKLADFEVKHFKNTPKVNILQFGASDGSEAYTKIISLKNNSYKNSVNKFFPIEAYDIDKEVLNAAKSGLINIRFKDIMRMAKSGINYRNYFVRSENKLEIPNDLNFDKSYTFSVINDVKNCVKFTRENLFNILPFWEDKSNTVLMCRNISEYLNLPDLNCLVELLSSRLKKGSLLIVGMLEKTGIFHEKIKQLPFKEIMNNVLLRI